MSDPNDLNSGDVAKNDVAGGNTGRAGGGWRRWLLIGSLALNLLVLAWLGMAALHWSGVIDHRGGFGHHDARQWESGPGGPSHHAGEGRGFQRPRGLFRAFLDERGIGDDARLRPIFERHGPALRAAFREARDARRRLRDLMAGAAEGDGLDKAALDGALAEVRRTTRAVQERMHATLLDAADVLTPEELEALVERGGPPRRDRPD
ncbi:periplasmic heavy metal sensor [Marivibrio halodurans]|uniref:Periplasmic heavy metal sensor n=1 Tax=Marivibrio halodurans TaxID=2039722 RepID=A0A8J7SKV6_9PROT|nr:periplasmic heavy metal sensor [Marivibrio halodurans]MBP5856443.1 periplasmic heavy metal sensor [Marivibrio halodurans]